MPKPRAARLAYGWLLRNAARLPAAVAGEFIQAPIAAIPAAMAGRLGPCRIALVKQLSGAIRSRWRYGRRLEIELAVEDADPHDLAMELLLCVGQALWTVLTGDENAAYSELLRVEMGAGVTGELDEAAVKEKGLLLTSRARARSRRQLECYLAASFAATAAEYVHALWHDVTVRSGRPEHLPASAIRARFELFERWFPPGAGRRLWP